MNTNKPRVPARNQAMFIKFVAFLKEQGALESYFKNLEFRRIFEYVPYNWVDAAFVWKDSPQGHDYWSNRAKVWKSY